MFFYITCSIKQMLLNCMFFLLFFRFFLLILFLAAVEVFWSTLERLFFYNHNDKILKSTYAWKLENCTSSKYQSWFYSRRIYFCLIVGDTKYIFFYYVCFFLIFFTFSLSAKFPTTAVIGCFFLIPLSTEVTEVNRVRPFPSFLGDVVELSRSSGLR